MTREAWMEENKVWADRARCKTCFDLRWLRQELSPGHPDYGKLLPCPNCAGAKYYVQHSGLLDTMAPEDADALNWERVVPTDNADIAARKVREVLARGYGWVFLHGGPGIAKSLILQIAIAETTRSLKHGTYTNLSYILDDLRNAYDTGYPSKEAAKRLRRWTDVSVLAIDELDKVKDTDFVIERRMRLLDGRYNSAKAKRSITLMASNQPPEYFDNYIADRIMDGRFEVIELTGESKRPSEAWREREDLR